MSIEARFRLRRSDFSLGFDQVMPSDGVIALFGASGSGKTTVLRCIAGLEHPRGGYLRVGAELWQDASRGLFVPSHRRRVGYVFQEASLFPHLRVRGNLDYAWKRVPARERRRTTAEVVELLGIARLLERSPAHLSGGERQRVAIARALLTSPTLLLMDEPLVALDRASKAEILPYLETLREELSIPVVYVSHAPDEVARLADYMVLLEKGRVRAAGPFIEMLTRLDLPLAHASEATSVIHSRVVGHDERFHLSYLEFSGGRFSIPRQALPVGHRVRLRVHARDVSLTRLRQEQTSILNIFPARVLEIAEENPAQRMIRLETGGAFLLSRITAKSTHQLDLRPGSEVFAQVKSVALA